MGACSTDRKIPPPSPAAGHRVRRCLPWPQTAVMGVQHSLPCSVPPCLRPSSWASTPMWPSSLSGIGTLFFAMTGGRCPAIRLQLRLIGVVIAASGYADAQGAKCQIGVALGGYIITCGAVYTLDRRGRPGHRHRLG